MFKRSLLKKITTMILLTTIVANFTACQNSNTEVADTESSSVSSESTDELEVVEAVEDDFAGYPLDTDVSPTIYAGTFFELQQSYTSADESPFHVNLEELTGVDVEWQFVTSGTDETQSLNLTLAKSTLPDVIGGISLGEVDLLIEDGVLIDLAEYLPLYAPNYWEFLTDPENENILKTLTSDNGAISLFGGWKESEWGTVWVGPIIRNDILEAENLDYPETIEDWDNLLEIMYNEYDVQFSFVLAYYNLSGGFASGFDSFAGLNMQMYVDDGVVKSANTQSEWQDHLAQLNEWYEAGYIDPDVLTNDDATLKAKTANGEVGAVFERLSRLTYYRGVDEDNGTGYDWQGVSYTLPEEGGTAHKIQVTDVVYNTGVGISTDATEEEIEVICRFLDYFYTEEGQMYINYGIEDETYTIDDDGVVQWTELLTDDPEGMSEATLKYTTVKNLHIGEKYDWFSASVNDPVANEGVDAWFANQDAVEYLYPTVSFTADESVEKTNLESTISTYIEETALKFMIGEMDIETEFDTFVETLESMGINELVEIYQAAYDRYEAR